MGPGLAEMSNGCIVLDMKMCPDTLEALKPSRDPIKRFKMGVLGLGAGGYPCPPYALAMPYVGSSLI